MANPQAVVARAALDQDEVKAMLPDEVIQDSRIVLLGWITGECILEVENDRPLFP